MFGLGNFWGKPPSRFLKILNLPWFHSGNFKISKNALRQFISNRLPKHVITSTNWLMLIDTNKTTVKLFTSHPLGKR